MHEWRGVGKRGVRRCSLKGFSRFLARSVFSAPFSCSLSFSLVLSLSFFPSRMVISKGNDYDYENDYEND
jgi:hypothetical protein